MEGINDIFLSSSLKRWQVQNLDYKWYWILTVFFGWCSLEQLYLGSPRSFVLKNIANVFLLGYPWMYEALMASTARPQVEVFGSAFPVMTGSSTVPITVGAGRFKTETSGGDPAILGKHYNFLLYSIVLGFLGIVGGDSFLTGNFGAGFLRLFSLLTVFFAPIAILWWLYSLILYFIKTEDVLEQHWEFFGYPKPSMTTPCPGVLQQLTLWIGAVANAALTVLTDYIPFLKPIKTILDTFIASLEKTWGFAVDAWGFVKKEVTANVQAAASLAQQLQREPPSGNDLAAAKAGIEGRAATAATTATAAQLPTATATAAQLPTATATTATRLPPLTGGGIGDGSALPLALGITVGLILVSSLVLSLRRAYQKNAEAPVKKDPDQRGGEGDDVPPDPRGA